MTKFVKKQYLKSILTDITLQELVASLFKENNVMYSDMDIYRSLQDLVGQESPYYHVPFELFKEILVRIEGKTIDGVIIEKYDPNKMIRDLDREEGANAGPNQVVSGTTTTLNANLPEGAIGKWTVLIGNGGVIDDDKNPNTMFTGVKGNRYILAWILLQSFNTMSVVDIKFQ